MGQTFKTGSEDVILDAITYRSGTDFPATKGYTITIGEVSGTNFTTIASETSTQSVAVAVDDYITFILDTPITLSADTDYGFDLAMNSSTAGWQSGIPYLSSTANGVFADGQAYRSTVNALSTDPFSFINADKVFHLNLAAATIVPEPASIPLWTIAGLCLAGFARYRRQRNK